MDLKKIPYEIVELDIIAGKTFKKIPKGVRKLVPLIEDPNYEVTMSDSTPIMEYLEEKYPEPSLFPGDEKTKKIIREWCIRFDSKLGTASRRLAYSHIITEAPDALFDLLVKPLHPEYDKPILRNLISVMISLTLMSRYAIHLVREEDLYGFTDKLLEDVSQVLSKQKYVVGSQLTAADISLVSLLKPLEIVPYFSENPKYKVLFDYQRRLRKEYGLLSIPKEEELARRRKLRNQVTLSKVIFFPFTFTFSVFSYLLYNIVETLSRKKRAPVFNIAYSKSNETDADNDHRKIEIFTPWALMNGVFLGALYNLFIKLPRDVRYDYPRTSKKDD